MGCCKKKRLPHRMPCAQDSSDEKPKIGRGCTSKNCCKRERDAKGKPKAEGNIAVNHTHSTKRHVSSVSPVEKCIREKGCKAREPRPKKAPGATAERTSSASARRDRNKEKAKCHKKHCPKCRASSAKTASAEKTGLTKAQSDGKNKSCVNRASTSGNNPTKEDFLNMKKDDKGSDTNGALSSKTGLSKPYQVLKDPSQFRKFTAFYASDMIDLAGREKRRKAADDKLGLIRIQSFIHVKHPRAPKGVSPSDRLDSFDTNFLRIKTGDKTKQVQKCDVLRWINNDTQKTLRVLVKVHINKIRSKCHLREVGLDLKLNKASGRHNYDQAYLISDGKTHHTDSQGKDLNGRLKSVDYKARYAFELLAKGPESVLEVLEYFMDHSSYSKVMLHPSLRSMGIHGGKDFLGNWFWTVILCG